MRCLTDSTVQMKAGAGTHSRFLNLTHIRQWFVLEVDEAFLQPPAFSVILLKMSTAVERYVVRMRRLSCI